MPRSISKKPLLLIMCLAVAAVFSRAHAELPVEPIPHVEILPADYPESMVFVHDVNFDALIAGRVVLVDIASDTRNYKGALDASQFASFTESKERNELYVAETFYSRGTRGERTDVLTIYDKENLAPIDEIPLPGGKRGLVVANRYTIQLSDNDRFMFLFNFTPAASVLMLDMTSRTILSETAIPGCSLIYPTGKRGFSSLCSNGSMYSAQFDTKGQLIHQENIDPFFNVDEDPLFDKPVFIGQTAYFPSFLGMVQAIDLSENTPRPGKPWSLLSTGERKKNWRPGGWQIASASDAGLIYVLMHPEGTNGSHKDGGSEIWAFNPNTQKRVNRVKLKNWGVSIELTSGKTPYIVVTNADMQLDIYSAKTGEWIKMIGDTAAMPYNLHAVR
ncbi:MAG: amine dehydrogenase large subunit [Pseudomonadales bacterium]